MKDRPATFAANMLGLIAAAVGFGNPILAQQGSPVDPAKARFEETSKRELELRRMGSTPNKPADPKQLQKLMAEVQLDFERILTLHNELVRAISASDLLAFDFVSDATAEIRKRATHLQTILPFEKPDASDHPREKPKRFSDDQMKDALVKLCKHIESFITNPVIKTPGTVDAQESARARSDLKDLIDLGDSINKSARRLKEKSR